MPSQIRMPLKLTDGQDDVEPAVEWSAATDKSGRGVSQSSASAPLSAAGPTPRRTVWDAPEALLHLSNCDDEAPKPTKEADAYAFGLMLFHLFTRREPFSDQVRASSLESVLRAVAGRDLRPHFPVSSPGPIRELAASCWARNPARRPGFAAIQEALEEVIEARPREHHACSERHSLLALVSHSARP